jgi:hypothetical protein
MAERKIVGIGRDVKTGHSVPILEMTDFEDVATLMSIYGVSDADVVGKLGKNRVYLNRDGELILVLGGGSRNQEPKGAILTLRPGYDPPGFVSAFWSVTGKRELSQEEVASLKPALDAQQIRLAEIEARKRAERAEQEREQEDRRQAAIQRMRERDLYEVRGGSGYNDEQCQKGHVYRNKPMRIAEGEPEYLFVLDSRSRYHSEEGMSFGVGADEGYSYFALCREATNEEIKNMND